MASATEIRTRRMAILVNTLVEKLYPMAPLKVFSAVTRELFNNEGSDSEAESRLSNSVSLGMDLLKLKGEDAVDLYSTIAGDNPQLAKRLLVLLMTLGGHYDEKGQSISLLHREDPATRERRTQLCRDFITGLQGVAGHYLRNTETRSLVLTRGEEEILLETLDFGQTVSKVRGYAGKLVAEPSLGIVSQRFGHAVLDELGGFDRFLSLFEKQTLGDYESRVTIYQMRSWCQTVFTRIRILKALCDNCESLRGGTLCSAIYAFTMMADPPRVELANRILAKVFSPLETMIYDFASTGRLTSDPHSEFFVMHRKHYFTTPLGQLEDEVDFERQTGMDSHNSRESIYFEYVVNPAMIPTFIGKEVAHRILRCGCEAKLALQMNFPLSKRTVPEPARVGDEVTAETIMNRLETFIRELENSVNEALVRALKVEHHLEFHLLMMKRFLLLSQGDFAQYLLELTHGLLSQPVGHVSKMELLSRVEQACRISVENESPEFQDLLEHRMDCVLIDDDRSALAWDVFTLAYHLDFPLTLVVPTSSQIKYQRVFQFLWRLKRCQFNLEQTWKQQQRAMTNRRAEFEYEPLQRVIHKCHLIRAEMVHFVTNLLSYVMFEVLETCYEQLRCDMEVINRFSDLIRVHDDYLDEILLKALIVDDEQSTTPRQHAADIEDHDDEVIAETFLQGRRGRLTSSKSPVFAIRSADMTRLEVRSLATRIEKLFDIVLKFCALQNRFFMRLDEERQVQALMRRAQSARRRERHWAGNSARIDDEAEDAENSEQHEAVQAGGRAISDEYGEQIDFVASEFWDALYGFLKTLDVSTSDILRFLGIRLDFNKFY